MFLAMIQSKANVRGFPIFRCINSGEGDTQLAAGLHDTDGYLTAVTDKDSMVVQ